jgi:hypothetical protein
MVCKLSFYDVQASLHGVQTSFYDVQTSFDDVSKIVLKDTIVLMVSYVP